MQTTLTRALRSLVDTIRPLAHRDTGGHAGPARRSTTGPSVGLVMSRPPRTCRVGDTLTQAAQVMWEHDCGCLPVIDDDGRLVAMITDRDICMAAYTQGRALWQLPVSSAASQSVVAVREDDPIEVAEDRMRHHRVRRLAVIDAQDRPVGVLSLCDLTRHSRFDHHPGEIPPERVAKILAAICG